MTNVQQRLHILTSVGHTGIAGRQRLRAHPDREALVPALVVHCVSHPPHERKPNADAPGHTAGRVRAHTTNEKTPRRAPIS